MADPDRAQNGAAADRGRQIKPGAPAPENLGSKSRQHFGRPRPPMPTRPETKKARDAGMRRSIAVRREVGDEAAWGRAVRFLPRFEPDTRQRNRNTCSRPLAATPLTNRTHDREPREGPAMISRHLKITELIATADRNPRRSPATERAPPRRLVERHPRAGTAERRRGSDRDEADGGEREQQVACTRKWHGSSDQAKPVPGRGGAADRSDQARPKKIGEGDDAEPKPTRKLQSQRGRYDSIPQTEKRHPRCRANNADIGLRSGSAIAGVRRSSRRLTSLHPRRKVLFLSGRITPGLFQVLDVR